MARKKKEIGWENREVTKLSKYEFEEMTIHVGMIYRDYAAITDIEKIEWYTRIKPEKKCVHIVKYYDMRSGKDGEITLESFWKYFISPDSYGDDNEEA